MLVPIAPRLATDIPAEVAADFLHHSWASYSRTLRRVVIEHRLAPDLLVARGPITLVAGVDDPDAPPPTLWQRIKAAVAPTMADSVIERYVTPEHLPVLLGYRRIYRGTVRPALGLKEPPSALAGTWLDGTGFDRFASFWVRVRRAVFMSPMRFILEVEDKYRPGRQFVGTLELKGYDWKLTGLSVTGGGGL